MSGASFQEFVVTKLKGAVEVFIAESRTKSLDALPTMVAKNTSNRNIHSHMTRMHFSITELLNFGCVSNRRETNKKSKCMSTVLSGFSLADKRKFALE